MPSIITQTRVLASLSILTWFIGCFATTNVSRSERYRNYIEKPLALDQDTFLVARHNSLFGSHGVMTLHSAQYGLVATLNKDDGPAVAKLNRGHAISLFTVREEIVGDNFRVVAYGKTKLPGTERTVTFACPYADNLRWDEEAPAR